MHCPFCSKAETNVLESRTVEEGAAIRRRRQCSHCRKRFTTFEKVKGNYLWIIKKDGRREMFDKEKVKKGILRAVMKRPISMKEIEEIADDVEREILRKELAEVDAKQVGNTILKRLKKLDKVAWLRFASVYMEFADLSDFEKSIEKEIK